MKKDLNKNKKFISTLYLVPTPIGNLEDISKRALFILSNVDFIIAENRYRANFLLRYFEIKKKDVIVFNKYNENIKTNEIIKYLLLGNNMALISNSGTPLISDPGYRLVNMCFQQGNSEIIKVIPLPGPCAIITALIASGLSINKFCYEGFLPVKKSLELIV